MYKIRIMKILTKIVVVRIIYCVSLVECNECGMRSKEEGKEEI